MNFFGGEIEHLAVGKNRLFAGPFDGLQQCLLPMPPTPHG